MFRVVRYLPGDWRSALLDDDRRAGVAQASREETAEWYALARTFVLRLSEG